MSTSHSKSSSVIMHRAALRRLWRLCAGFIIASVLLNATGIRLWAQRLEIQDSWVPRTQLIELATAWENFIEPIGLNAPRQKVMAWRSIENNSATPAKIEIAPQSKVTSNVIDQAKDQTKDQSKRSSNELALNASLEKVAENPKVENSPKAVLEQSSRSSSTQTIPESSLHGYIALTGDSMMAVSFGPNLAKLIEKNSQLKVIRAYKSGTGLSRPDVFNWLVEYPKMLAGRSPSIVVCAIGANDAQGFEVNKKVIPFGTSAWEEEYARRAQTFIELMLKNGAKVYWVLLPHMRSPVYSQKMQNLNKFLQEQFKGIPNLIFLTPDPLMVGKPVQSYVEFSPGENQKMDRLRGDDGIHLSEMGGKRLAQGIWLKINQSQ